MRKVVLSLSDSVIFTNKLLGNRNPKDKHGMAVSVVNVPDFRVGELGDTGGALPFSSALGKLIFRGLKLSPSFVRLLLTRAASGSRFVVRTAWQACLQLAVSGFLGVLFPARCQVVLKSERYAW